MKTLKKLVVCIGVLSSGATLCATNQHNNDPFLQLFEELNRMVNEVHQQNTAGNFRITRKPQYQQPRSNRPSIMPFFNDPFFDDTFNRLFGEALDGSESYYSVWVNGEPVYQGRPRRKQIPQKQPKQIQQPQVQRPQLQQPQYQTRPQAQKPNIQRWQQPTPQANSPFGGFFPLMGQQGRPGYGQGTAFGKSTQQQYQQYNAADEKTVSFKDVLGQDEAIREVSEVVDFLKNPAKYHRLGAEIPKGILLEGPPGCGKTLLARAVAGEANCTFIHASGSQFINKYVGTGADNIRKLFDQARSANGPAIIFLDEIDAIGSREKDENQEYRHTINELLTQLDGFKEDENVIVIAATNFSKSLDKALLRPGRFDRIIHVGRPSKNGREKILKYYIDKKNMDPAINTDQLAKEFAQRTTQFSGAQLKQLVNEWALVACRKNAPCIVRSHCEEGYDKVTLGLKNDLDRSPEQLKRTAYHEAGHALVKILTDQPVAKMTILSRGDALGATFEKEKYESFSEYQKQELLDKIMALQAGAGAEKVALNCSRPGASADHQQAYGIASAMIKEFGMGNNELNGLRYSRDMSETWKSKFDAEIAQIIHDCREKTEKLLTDNKDLLTKLSEELLEKETMSEEEIYKALGKTLES